MKIKKSNKDNQSVSYINTNCKVFNFPAPPKKHASTTLTDDDLKALFMGLVKIVKDNAVENNSHDIKLFMEQLELQKRKEAILLKQKQTEIDILNKKIIDLQQKNIKLQNILTDYRLNFVKLKSPKNKFNN